MSVKFIPEKTVQVPEISFKDEITLPADKTAVIVVDMQNDFVKPAGALVVPAAQETVPHIQALLTNAREHGVRVAYTQDTHLEGTPEWEIWPEHVKENTWGWEIIEELAPQEGEPVCRKPRYDGFYASNLDHYLSHLWHVEHLVIVGTVSNICVLHTAASAGLRWFHIVVPANGISALTDFDQALTLRQVSTLYNGHVIRDVADAHFE
ncbi:MAG: cysteine hydrolase family protein [Anaerolineae bacterium]